ncbi:hypothetical protein EVAR_31279_1 [Eumeta japonica]|uniref:Uncharacterized protein n=1 Tax=Eumeta variegata TaxID=151549 RepID=A0A4C1VTK4_EUMVA|nr:hypothetical protein EVAR_31279_1 [Eumeta japonica]
MWWHPRNEHKVVFASIGIRRNIDVCKNTAITRSRLNSARVARRSRRRRGGRVSGNGARRYNDRASIDIAVWTHDLPHGKRHLPGCDIYRWPVITSGIAKKFPPTRGPRKNRTLTSGRRAKTAFWTKNANLRKTDAVFSGCALGS